MATHKSNALVTSISVVAQGNLAAVVAASGGSVIFVSACIHCYLSLYSICCLDLFKCVSRHGCSFLVLLMIFFVFNVNVIQYY